MKKIGAWAFFFGKGAIDLTSIQREDKTMSKYSTDELITNLNCHFYPSPTGESGDDYRLAIIAKLRAGDKTTSVTREQIERFVGGSLCKAMDSEEMADAVQCFLRSLGIDIKAIAEYEGEKP